MNIQRGTVKALSVLAILATAGGAGAQEQQWAAPPTPAPGTAQTTKSVTTVSTTDLTMPPPIVTSYTSARDVGAESGANKLDHYMAPIRRGFEIQVGGGYGQGLGNVARGERSLTDYSGPGATLELALGYRAMPRFMIGLYGTASQFSRTSNALADGTDLRSATAGVQADFHFRPSYTIDPWISLASGWRGYFITPDVGRNTTEHGLQLARLQVGADFRVTREVAVAPVIGGDASMFLTRNGPGTDGFDNIQDPRVNFFLFGGLQARFDLGSRRSSAYTGVASSGTRSAF